MKVELENAHRGKVAHIFEDVGYTTKAKIYYNFTVLEIVPSGIFIQTPGYFTYFILYWGTV